MANLAALLDQEASAEIEAILSEARERASEITSKAEEDAEAIVAQKKRTLSSQYDAAKVQARSAAQLEAASKKLRAQHQAVEDVFDRAKDELHALIDDKDRYRPVFSALLKEAVDELGRDNIALVMVSPEDRDLATETLGEHDISAEVETDDTLAGGMRVRAAKTSVSIENTLIDRLEAARDELASEVSQVLLADEGA
ncbi:MAG: V-type ATP synthase subunit E [Trueperaceae bacterium]|nr:V-type ATP synthase subunit E [Trueperaceae bacterium]